VVAEQSPVAGIDIGTNSVRLSIRERSGRELERQMHITRLGQGVDGTGRLHPDAIERTLQVLRRYQVLCQQHGVGEFLVAATSAARDAHNRSEFFGPARAIFGRELELLSGDEEASLSFRGATSDLPSSLAPFVVLDIGGGSTEFARGHRDPSASISLDLGSVRLTERCLHGDPPTPQELEDARATTLELLERASAAVDLVSPATWVGVAGTVTTLAALTLGQSEYEPERTHGSELTRDEIERAFARLARVPAKERAPLLIQPARAGIIVAGALILLTILDRFGVRSLRVSERDILDGLVDRAAGLG
jgi:exopolyphosphatase/guanosine-5'-triphosphate,3'-diphosphate pyrophosphatase